MPTIFLCYRRSETEGVAGRLYDRLVARFGKDQVFRDIDRIPGGADFIAASEQALESAEAFVPLIGANWLSLTDDRGLPRLAQPDDRVRVEIRLALEAQVPIFPVLVESAEMPKSRQLPSDISKLARYNALPLRSDSFDHHFGQLLQSLGEVGLSPTDSSPGQGLLSSLVTGLAQAIGERASRPAQPVSPQAPTPSLTGLLAGTWQLQIYYPNGLAGQAAAQFWPNGQFHVRGSSPAAQFEIQGTWAVTAAGLLQLSGQQGDGFQLMPYAAMIQFGQVSPNQLQGTANTGERFTWTRTG